MAENKIIKGSSSLFGGLQRLYGVKKAEDTYTRPKAVASMPYQSIQAFNSVKQGIKKTDVGIDFATLRRIARCDSVSRVAIGVIKKEVSQSPWAFVKRQSASKIDEGEKKAAYELFEYQNQDGENYRMLLDRVVDDICTIDAGAIEVISNAKGQPITLNSVDGATIQPNLNKYGEFGEVAYFQVVDNKVVAEFSANEIVYIMQNPQNDIKRYGYGMSPIESIILTINASLNADLYNANLFSTDNVPPGIINLGNVNEYEAEAIKQMWDAQTIGKSSQLRFLYGTELEFINFKASNKDMQYQEYLDWLTRIKLAAFGLSGIDANILQDVNRSTAESQARISQARGVRSMKHLIEEAINTKIIKAAGFTTIDFEFEKYTDMAEKEQQAKIYKIYVDTGIVTANEVREELGMKAMSEVRYIEEEVIPEEMDEDETALDDGEKEDIMEETQKGNSSVEKQSFPLLY